MVVPKLIVPLAASVTLAGSALTGSLATAAGTRHHSLLQSRQLWATIDVCNPPDKANTIGIRGSMPSDGDPTDELLMRFQVQYLDAKSDTWIDVAQGDSGFVAVSTTGSSSARQGGRSFQFAPPSAQESFTLRGVVSFQWRRSGHVIHSATRPTSAGHTSLAGADPAGYTAAKCVIG
jgi:hypothetical protein